MDFAIPPDHKVKINEREKRDKYLDLARGLRKLLNMTVTVMPIVVGTVGNRGTNQDPPNYRIVEIGILRRVLETPGDLLSNSSQRTSANASVKNLPEIY